MAADRHIDQTASAAAQLDMNPDTGHSHSERVAAEILHVGGIGIALDQYGHLLHAQQWSEALAMELAARDNIQLTEAHWQLIRFVRSYHDDYGIAPGMRLLVAAVRQRLSPELASSRYLYHLFPDSPARQLSCYAGLPIPVSCI